MFNAYWEPLTFEIPPLPNEKLKSWHLIVDTAASPNDIYDTGTAPVIDEFQFRVNARSIVALLAK